MTAYSRPKVVSADEIDGPDYKRSPFHNIMSQVEGDWWTYSDAAKWFGVTAETLRKFRRMRRLDVPSHAVKQGKMTIWLWNMADIQAVEEWYENAGYELDRKINPKKTLAEQRPE